MTDDKELQDDFSEVDDVDSIENEDLELEESEALSKDKINTLRKKLSDCESDKILTLEELQRVRADFLNSKRRLEEQLSRDRERIATDILTDFLPLLDSFDTAIGNSGEIESHTDSWKKGVVAMHAQFMSLLKKYEIEEIDALGKVFNPYEHEAVSGIEAPPNTEPGTVVSVLQKGFKRKEMTIRPAKVIVTNE